MWSRRKVFVLVLAATVLVLAGAAGIWVTRARGPRKPAEISRGDYTYAIERARHEIEQVMAQRHIPGAAVVLIDDQEIVWHGSFGLADRENEIPVDADTVFKMWSLAKPFTALELMRLVEEGRLDLDAPLDATVPGFTIQSRFSDGDPITLRHLLAHRAGLPRSGCRYGMPWQTGPDALTQLADALARCYLAYPTGTRYKYSNVGYVTLGYIIQAQRDQPFPLYMRDQLLRPLGMTHSAFYSTELPPGSAVALGYEYFEGDYYRYEQEDIGNIPSGNLYATAGDLASLVQFIFRDGDAQGEQLIGPETLAAMFEDSYSRPADPQPMGLGWKLGRVWDTELLAWHDGGPTEGTGSLIAMLPERQLGVVLLGNGVTFEGSVALPIATELLEVMLETRDGLTAPAGEREETVAVDAAVLEAYAGSYALFGDAMAVTVDGDQLQGTIEGMSFDLVPLTEDRFRVSHWLLKLGLADFLQLPMDLGELRIEFRAGEAPAQDVMIVDFGGVNYEICPRIPALPEDENWEALVGQYELYALLRSGQPARERLGESDITLDEGVLSMAGAVGPIRPIDDRTLIILSGPFHGETIGYNAETGALTHQGLLFTPVSTAAGQ